MNGCVCTVGAGIRISQHVLVTRHPCIEHHTPEGQAVSPETYKHWGLHMSSKPGHIL